MKAAADSAVCACPVDRLEALVAFAMSGRQRQGAWLVGRWKGPKVALEALPLELGLLESG